MWKAIPGSRSKMKHTNLIIYQIGDSHTETHSFAWRGRRWWDYTPGMYSRMTHESLKAFSGITLLVAWDAASETAVWILGGRKTVLCWSREPGYLVSRVGDCQGDNKTLRKKPFLEKHGNEWQLGSTEHLRSTGGKRLGLLGEAVSSGCSVGKAQDEPQHLLPESRNLLWLLGPITRMPTRLPLGFLHLACFQGSAPSVCQNSILVCVLFASVDGHSTSLSLPVNGRAVSINVPGFVWDEGDVLELDSGDGYTTLWKCLMPPNWTL